MAVVIPKTIIITTMSGKSGCTSLPSIRGLNILPTSMIDDSVLDYEFEDESPGPEPRKRKRLTHLSPEERMMRRKLKNRVAAQTARDRKKARMTILEEQVALLEAENDRLQHENKSLKVKTGSLSQENSHLKEKLGLTASGTVPSKIIKNEVSKTTTSPTSTTCMKSVIIKNEHGLESAELSSPQQQEQIHALFLLTTHFIAYLMTLSLTHCWDSYSSSQKLHPALLLEPQTQPLDLRIRNTQHKPHIKWWGRQQQSWNPSMN